MNQEIQAAIDNLAQVVRKNASDTTVAFNLFINYREAEAEFRTKTPEGLKTDGISMRNLKGEFIGTKS